MHDWTLINIFFDWKSAQVKLDFFNHNSLPVFVLAKGVSNLLVPRFNQWGPSVSVNKVGEVVRLENGKQRLKVEMQSGDVIEVDADVFEFP